MTDLIQLGLILHADSLLKLFKLVLVMRTRRVVVCCALWLLVNLLAQSGLAVLGLTYSFDTDLDKTALTHGNVSGMDMSRFYPPPEATRQAATITDERYLANMSV